MVYKLKAKLQKAGDVSIAAYLKAHSPEAEVQALERVLSLAEKARVRLHVAHVTADRSLELIKKAKKGLSLTCEVSPHHLLLTEGKLDLMGNIALTDPPLRALSHVKRLWRGVEEGIIDIIASDHAPHLLTEKEGKDPWEAPPGIPGLETALPLMLTQVKRGRISLHRLISMLSERPVQIFGLKGKGRLAAGFDADLTVIDLKKEGVVSPPNFCSKAKYSPFEGYRTVGKAVKTLVKGELVMDEGEVVGSPGTGEVLRIS
jgi:dihydroorotase